ncbi:toll/interleukin-1 receptor domain-containing protein [Pseudomonas syringae]|uniref:toll/interleukin-1 receptor domain-containing protein n=1 Tax=Pseudomonas syringae TaxID=317 RepID=UPI001F0F24B0|nr:toll/interleukin-1 receptor domain-containing protein [Pseudomonas syringae]MCH5516940.1 toll/interleukin-1 receptor domain-containing protein [Pseudomonas syringae pv. syringae]MCH5630074.1 toll/interleukin-1 receptor domain-containing protein [Pseudomonas syringae pv. syringae]
MKTTIFISYAWTSNEHRQWIRLLATQLRLLGYTVLIDSAVPYGSSLSGFMREVTASDRVLIIADQNYVERADDRPESGVGIENKWLMGVFQEKPTSWLSVLFVGNPSFRLPRWLADENPKGFDFNSVSEKDSFPGVEQMDDLWRWIEGLPADKAHAIPAAVLLERMARIERIDALRDPANYANPALKDRVTFAYKDNRHYTIGHGEYEFKLSFSERSINGVYMYRNAELKAIGIITASNIDKETVETYLRQADHLEPVVGQLVVVMNLLEALCIIRIVGVETERHSPIYTLASITFSYEVLVGR